MYCTHDFENAVSIGIFKNIMIIDKLFKANGHIYNNCLDLYQKYQDYEHCTGMSVNGFNIVIDDNDDSESFLLTTETFRFVIESETIFCLFGWTSVQIETGFPDDNFESELEDFYQVFLALINVKSKRSFNRIEQFIDEYNLKYMTHL